MGRFGVEAPWHERVFATLAEGQVATERLGEQD